MFLKYEKEKRLLLNGRGKFFLWFPVTKGKKKIPILSFGSSGFFPQTRPGRVPTFKDLTTQKKTHVG